MGKESNLVIGLAAGAAILYFLKPQAVKDAIGGAIPSITNLDLSNLFGGLSEGIGEQFDLSGLLSDSPFAGFTLPEWITNPPPWWTGDGNGGGGGGGGGGEGDGGEPAPTPNIWQWFTGLPQWAQLAGAGTIGASVLGIGASVLGTLGLGGYAASKVIPLIKPTGQLALKTVRPVATAAGSTAGRWITNLGRGKFPWAGGQRGFVGTGTLGSLALILGVPVTAMGVLGEVLPRIDPRFGAWNYNPFSSRFWTDPFSKDFWTKGIRGFNSSEKGIRPGELNYNIAHAEAATGQPESPIVVTSEKGFTASSIGETLPPPAPIPQPFPETVGAGWAERF